MRQTTRARSSPRGRSGHEEPAAATGIASTRTSAERRVWRKTPPGTVASQGERPGPSPARARPGQRAPGSAGDKTPKHCRRPWHPGSRAVAFRTAGRRREWSAESRPVGSGRPLLRSPSPFQRAGRQLQQSELMAWPEDRPLWAGGTAKGPLAAGRRCPDAGLLKSSAAGDWRGQAAAGAPLLAPPPTGRSPLASFKSRGTQHGAAEPQGNRSRGPPLRLAELTLSIRDLGLARQRR